MLSVKLKTRSPYWILRPTKLLRMNRTKQEQLQDNVVAVLETLVCSFYEAKVSIKKVSNKTNQNKIYHTL